MNNNSWFDYWSKATCSKRQIRPSCIAYYLCLLGHSEPEDDFLYFYIDTRKGKTEGAYFLFSEPGKEGSVLATPEEANFLQEKIKG